MITKKFKCLKFKSGISNIPSARIKDAFVNGAALGVIHKINNDKLINKTYTEVIPQIILVITTFLQSYYFELILTCGDLNIQKIKTT